MYSTHGIDIAMRFGAPKAKAYSYMAKVSADLWIHANA